MSECNHFLLYRNVEGRWGTDGCHDSGDDMTRTYQILESLKPAKDLYLMIEVDNGFPRVVADVTAEAKASRSVQNGFDPSVANMVNAYRERSNKTE